MQFEVPFEIIKYILCKYFIVIEISLPVKKKAFFFCFRIDGSKLSVFDVIFLHYTIYILYVVFR